MKRFNFKLRNVAIILACLAAVTMTACGQGSKQNADTTQVKVQTQQDAQKALAQLQQDLAAGKITREQYVQKMQKITEAMRGTTMQRQPANQMSAEEIQRRISEGQAAADETMKAYDAQLGNMSWPPQDAFKRFGYYVPQPELDAPYGVRIRWELKQGKGHDGAPSEHLIIAVSTKHPATEMQISHDKKWAEIAKTLSQEESVRLYSFTKEEVLAVVKIVQSCGAGRSAEGGVSPQDCNYFQKPDPQRTHTDKWQHFIATEVRGGGTIEINITTFANPIAQGK
jgi:TolA-binding protein